MKKIALFLTVLAASVALSALPALSRSGPFGTVGPLDNAETAKAVGTDHVATPGGSGPYGAFGFVGTEPGVVSASNTIPGGTGPYGALNSNGVIPGSWSASVENKTGCLLVAMNCPPDK